MVFFIMETTTREDKYFPLGLGRIVERVVARDDDGGRVVVTVGLIGHAAAAAAAAAVIVVGSRDDVGRVAVEDVLQVLQLDARLAMVTPQLGLVHPETYDPSTAESMKTDGANGEGDGHNNDEKHVVFNCYCN